MPPFFETPCIARQVTGQWTLRQSDMYVWKYQLHLAGVVTIVKADVQA